MKTIVEVSELLNAVRNDAFLAHENWLIEPTEAR